MLSKGNKSKGNTKVNYDVVILGIGQSPYIKRPDPSYSTIDTLAKATQLAIADSGLSLLDIDGLAVSSFTLKPDQAIDVALKFGLKVHWIMDGSTGGASGIDMVQHARAAILAGDAKNILVVAGDVFHQNDFTDLVENYNRNTQEYLTQIGIKGPNPLFAMLTSLQMAKLNIALEDYGKIVCRQREWAASNPNAIYREPLSIQEYLNASPIATPLRMFDCVPVTSGANALVLSSDHSRLGHTARIVDIAVNHNFDNHEGDGTSTGLSEIAAPFLERNAIDISRIEVLSVYDDYPAIVLAQLIDLGLIDPLCASESIDKLMANPKIRINSSGGQLSSGQCGAGAGLHGVYEIIDALRKDPTIEYRTGLVSGYGMVGYRYGMCANLLALEVI
jgi:acetyl-CoA acetyltransferase